MATLLGRMIGVATPALPERLASLEGAREFEAIYDSYFPYVWSSVQRLGVPPSSVDDVVQEIFIIVHAKLASFEGRSSVKTWLFAITLRVARNHRQKLRRRPGDVTTTDVSLARAPDATRPDQQAEHAEAARLVNEILDGLDDDQREVFVLADLEELSAAEIAEALDVKLNTVYSRLRLARAAFSQGAARLRARDGWRMR